MKWIIVLLVGETINKELTTSGLLLEEKVAITQISKHAPKNLQSIKSFGSREQLFDLFSTLKDLSCSWNNSDLI